MSFLILIKINKPWIYQSIIYNIHDPTSLVAAKILGVLIPKIHGQKKNEYMSFSVSIKILIHNFFFTTKILKECKAFVKNSKECKAFVGGSSSKTI